MEKLRETTVHEKLVAQGLYKTNTNYVIRNWMKSKGFYTEREIRLKRGVSPILFNINMDNIKRKSERKINKIAIALNGSRKKGKITGKLEHMVFNKQAKNKIKATEMKYLELWESQEKR